MAKTQVTANTGNACLASWCKTNFQLTGFTTSDIEDAMEICPFIQSHHYHPSPILNRQIQ